MVATSLKGGTIVVTSRSALISGELILRMTLDLPKWSTSALTKSTWALTQALEACTSSFNSASKSLFRFTRLSSLSLAILLMHAMILSSLIWLSSKIFPTNSSRLDFKLEYNKPEEDSLASSEGSLANYTMLSSYIFLPYSSI